MSLSKKICFITTSLTQGGLENAVTVMANEMARRGNNVTIINFYNQPVFYKLDDKINLIFPDFYREKFNTLTYYSKVLLYVRKNIIKTNPDTIVSYGDYINFITILANVKLKIPVYISDRSSPDKKFPIYVKKLRKFLYPKANGILAQTERAKNQKLKMLGRKCPRIKIIPNPIRPLKEDIKISRKKTILGVARHKHVKGLDRLIEAYSLLENKEWDLIIAGNYGPHTEELKKIIKENGLEESVKLLGPIEEIDKIYYQASIFVLPSRSEGFPNALIEAMACGLACISFNVSSGPSDIINDGINGILVEDGNIVELKNQMAYLINDERKLQYLSVNASKIKEELSVEKIGEIFFNFVTEDT